MTDEAGPAPTTEPPRRRLLVRLRRAALAGWVLLTVAAVVLAVLWLRDAEDRDVAREVQITQKLWRQEVADLRRFDADVGTIWTYDRLRPRAINDEQALVSPTRPGAPYVLTVPDASTPRCEAGIDDSGARPRLTVCDTSPEGWDLGTSDEIPDAAGRGDYSVGVVAGISRPGPTDVRLEILVDVPGPVPTDRASLQAYLRQALALAPEALEDSDFAPLQAVDMRTTEWDDFEFMFSTQTLYYPRAPLQD